MRSLIFLFLFFVVPINLYAQEYVDIFTGGYGQTLLSDFENADGSTTIHSFDTNITIPFVLNEKTALITGFDFSYSGLQLFENASDSKLYSTTLKLGLSITHSEKWSGTYVLLPKIASDYKNITGDDFYLGAFLILKYKKNEHLKYRFGLYGSQEAYGFFMTPIFGISYTSPNTKFEADLSLPISANINYKLSNKTALGFDYIGLGRTFKLSQDNTKTVYIEHGSLDFSTYFQYAFTKNMLLRAKIGYTTNSFEVYDIDDTIDFGLSAFQFGDDRTQLNPDIKGNIFFKIEAVYRVFITSEKSD